MVWWFARRWRSRLLAVVSGYTDGNFDVRWPAGGASSSGASDGEGGARHGHNGHNHTARPPRWREGFVALDALNRAGGVRCRQPNHQTVRSPRFDCCPCHMRPSLSDVVGVVVGGGVQAAHYYSRLKLAIGGGPGFDAIKWPPLIGEPGPFARPSLRPSESTRPSVWMRRSS